MPEQPPKPYSPQQSNLAAQNPNQVSGQPNTNIDVVLPMGMMQTWQAPYPPPDAVERYEKILPGSFDRILKMGEQLQTAQIEESRRINDYTYATGRRGHWMAFAAIIFAMFGAVFCTYFGNAWIGGAFLSVPVMAAVKVFIESTGKKESGTPAPKITP